MNYLTTCRFRESFVNGVPPVHIVAGGSFLQGGFLVNAIYHSGMACRRQDCVVVTGGGGEVSRRRSMRSLRQQARALLVIVVMGIAYAILRWLTTHWWISLLVVGAAGYWFYRRWKRQRNWLDAFQSSGITTINGMTGRMFEERLRIHFNEGMGGAANPNLRRLRRRSRRHRCRWPSRGDSGKAISRKRRDSRRARGSWWQGMGPVVTNSSLTANATTYCRQQQSAVIQWWSRGYCPTILKAFLTRHPIAHTGIH